MSYSRGSNSPTAIASVAYDVLNGRIPDAQLEPISIDERTPAMRHMDMMRILKFYFPGGTLETLATNDFGLDKRVPPVLLPEMADGRGL